MAFKSPNRLYPCASATKRPGGEIMVADIPPRSNAVSRFLSPPSCKKVTSLSGLMPFFLKAYRKPISLLPPKLAMPILFASKVLIRFDLFGGNDTCGHGVGPCAYNGHIRAAESRLHGHPAAGMGEVEPSG